MNARVTDRARTEPPAASSDSAEPSPDGSSIALTSDPTRGKVVTIVGIDGDSETDNYYDDHGEILRGVSAVLTRCLAAGNRCNLIFPKIAPYFSQINFCQAACRHLNHDDVVARNRCLRICRTLEICYYDPNVPGDLMRCKGEMQSDLNIDICHNIPSAGGIQNCDNQSGVGEDGTPTRVICCKPGLIPDEDKHGECTYLNDPNLNLNERDIPFCVSDLF